MSLGPSPAVLTLDRCLRTGIPMLAGDYEEWSGKRLPRLQIITADGRHKTGLALDIILFCGPNYAKDKSLDIGREKALAENLVKTFVELKSAMKWNEILLENRAFMEPDSGYTAYTNDNKHYTHIHIDWMTNRLKGKGLAFEDIVAESPQSQETGFAAALQGRLGALNAGYEAGSLASVNLAGIQKTLSPDLNPVGDWWVNCAQWRWMYSFKQNGTVVWRDPYNGESGKGRWQIDHTSRKIVFSWEESATTERWDLPLSAQAEGGETRMKGVSYRISAARA